MYGKIINGMLQYAPANLKIGKSLIVNFNQNEKLLKENGFKEVKKQDIKIDPDNQYLVQDGYEETDQYIIIKYTAKDREPTIEERLDIVEETIINLTEN